jgi:hypothetical protein
MILSGTLDACIKGTRLIENFMKSWSCASDRNGTTYRQWRAKRAKPKLSHEK